MFFFGHEGLTLGAVATVEPRADLRWPALAAILPDLVDKPVALTHAPFLHGNTRNLGHTLIASLAAGALVRALGRPRRDVALFWACYAGHYLLDLMWIGGNPRVLGWPFFGPFPPPPVGTPVADTLVAYNLVGEALGIVVLASIWRSRRLGDGGAGGPCSGTDVFRSRSRGAPRLTGFALRNPSNARRH